MSYATAAAAQELTRARETQVMNLLLLAPEIQEQVLVAASNVRERGLRRVLQQPYWTDQLFLWSKTPQESLSPSSPHGG